MNLAKNELDIWIIKSFGMSHIVIISSNVIWNRIEGKDTNWYFDYITGVI